MLLPRGGACSAQPCLANCPSYYSYGRQLSGQRRRWQPQRAPSHPAPSLFLARHCREQNELVVYETVDSGSIGAGSTECNPATGCITRLTMINTDDMSVKWQTVTMNASDPEDSCYGCFKYAQGGSTGSAGRELECGAMCWTIVIIVGQLAGWLYRLQACRPPDCLACISYYIRPSHTRAAAT